MLVEDLTLLKVLGKGSFGEVYLTSKTGCKEKFATKKISKKFTQNPKAKKYLDNEINILKEINHPNIVKLYEVKDTSNFFYLVTEYCNSGGLQELLDNYIKKNKKPFPEEVVQYFMKQIVSAIYYLHKHNILHRDIKLDNILVHYDSEEDKAKNNFLKAKIKLIDFGFARHLNEGDLAQSILGSPINMDPGILRKLNKMAHSKEYGYDQKADIWSLGTACYEMLIGKNAFDAKSLSELVKKVEEGNYKLPTTISKEAVSFINGMIQYDLKKRLSAEELYHHPFLTTPYSQLTKIIIRRNSNKVIGSQVLMNAKKMNESIWDVFGEEREILDGIHSQRVNTNNNQNIKNNYLNDIKAINLKDSGSLLDEIHEKKTKIDLKKEFLNAFDEMNEDFIYFEPKLIPIIPGDDPTVINKVSEFSEDNF
jgi:serine/threonine protein kinase